MNTITISYNDMTKAYYVSFNGTVYSVLLEHSRALQEAYKMSDMLIDKDYVKPDVLDTCL